jgi:hypothetical protein
MADHFSERGIFPADPLDIVHAELGERHCVFGHARSPSRLVVAGTNS